MNSQEMFSLSDEAIAKATKIIARRFSKAKTSLLGIDEINALDANKVFKSLYKNLKADFYALLKQLGASQYKKVFGKYGLEDDFVELFIIYGHDFTTGYVLDNEIDRKAERTAEAIIAAIQQGIDTAETMRKAASYMAQMFAQEADNTALAVTLQAYKDMGVEKVRWVTQRDEKVCKSCEPRDNRIYDIDAVPVRHWHCRCVLIPIKE